MNFDKSDPMLKASLVQREPFLCEKTGLMHICISPVFVIRF